MHRRAEQVAAILLDDRNTLCKARDFIMGRVSEEAVQQAAQFVANIPKPFHLSRALQAAPPTGNCNPPDFKYLRAVSWLLDNVAELAEAYRSNGAKLKDGEQREHFHNLTHKLLRQRLKEFNEDD